MFENEAEPLNNIALPNELPPPPDLTRLPQNILRSGAVETLIQQNEDLMARLAVNLRKISWLENQVMEIHQEKDLAAQAYGNLKDQLAIVQEKARSVAERKERHHSEFQKLEERIKILELECSELYTRLKEKEAQWELAQARHQKHIQRLEKYRRGMRVAIERLRQKEKEAVEVTGEEFARLTREREQIRSIADQLQIERSEIAKKLGQASEYIQSLSQKHGEDQRALVEQYEAKLQNAQNQEQDLRRQVEDLSQRLNDNDVLREKNIELENSLILLKRKRDELQGDLDGQLQQLQSQVSYYRTEAKTLKSQQGSWLEEREELKIKARRSDDEVTKLTEQVENIQVLWREQQNELEKQKLKTQALQRLNQQLSLKLNEYRSELTDLRVLSDGPKTTPANENPQVSKRIESLLAEIESGISLD